MLQNNGPMIWVFLGAGREVKSDGALCPARGMASSLELRAPPGA